VEQCITQIDRGDSVSETACLIRKMFYHTDRKQVKEKEEERERRRERGRLERKRERERERQRERERLSRRKIQVMI